jgi:propanol-preferring alcohol dehydrogenase
MKMAAVGLCGSDLHLLHAPAGVFPFSPPFTLGHENAGWIAEVGAGVTRFAPGDAVLASSASSCGHCEPCSNGHDNYCWDTVNMQSRMMSMRVRGIGLDGGLAEYVVVPERELVALRSLSPATAAPLADAGATSYHAVQTVLPVLRAGSTAVVIGAGGLGSYAIQYLRLLTTARVIALDVSEQRLDYARELGAKTTIRSDENARAAVLTQCDGVHAVLDFVGTAETLKLANDVVRPRGYIVVPGITFATTPFGWGISAPGAHMVLSMGFTLNELREVVELAEHKRIRVDVDSFRFDQIDKALAALSEHRVRGRAVIAMS